MKRLLLVIAGAAAIALIAWVTLRNTTRKPQPAAPAVQLPQPPSELAGVPRTTIGHAAEEIEKGRVRLIDVRDADSYIAGHIPGALQIPLMRIESEVGYLPRDKPIITYCT